MKIFLKIICIPEHVISIHDTNSSTVIVQNAAHSKPIYMLLTYHVKKYIIETYIQYEQLIF